jgi:hypothetical protein
MNEPIHLLNAGEVARQLGVTRRWVRILAERPDFPEPHAWTALGTGPMRLWLQEDVDRYDELVRKPALARRQA